MLINGQIVLNKRDIIGKSRYIVHLVQTISITLEIRMKCKEE